MTDAEVIPLPRTAWTATEIMAMEFPEPRWAVPGLIAEGLTVLAGPPKIGKSWMGLDLAVSIATGGKALGRVDVESGDVLYLALEDTPRRLQSRLGKVLHGAGAPVRLTFGVQCEPLPAGGADRISGWLEVHPDARLVIIDVFSKVRGMPPANMSSYDADYLAMARLKTLADRYGVAVLVIHHVRKAGAEDFLDTISGTNGLAGAADAVLVLRRARGKADAELHVTGRDVAEATYALNFTADLGAWQMLDGPADDYAMSDTRKVILDYLRDHEGSTPREIAEAISLNHNVVKQRCWQMSRDGQLDVADGSYCIPITHNPHNRVTDDQAVTDSPGYGVTTVMGYGGDR